MESSDGRVVLVIVIAMVLFFVGRRFQRTLDTWRGWGKAVKDAADAAGRITGARSAAWSAVRSMLLVGGATLAFIALVVNAIRSQ
ncbi:hypothetical protein [Nonomuraea africana]|uniref:Uncharacterized protein n=1 Tax=Nonomuraea africana TaxID=46171 RepID=A0ABR9KCR0_9ACTN|nr:hypothetical protein [Nonomuraea africana]MBE1559498.1 hypothetical protein [Nonomuraea africana]